MSTHGDPAAQFAKWQSRSAQERLVDLYGPTAQPQTFIVNDELRGIRIDPSRHFARWDADVEAKARAKQLATRREAVWDAWRQAPPWDMRRRLRLRQLAYLITGQATRHENRTGWDYWPLDGRGEWTHITTIPDTDRSQP